MYVYAYIYKQLRFKTTKKSTVFGYTAQLDNYEYIICKQLP